MTKREMFTAKGDKKMNKEIEKAIKNKEKNHPVHDWWGKNDYKIMRIIFFPIWIICLIDDKIEKWIYDRTVWDTKRVDEILNYYIPKTSDWNPEQKTFWFYNNGYGWNITLAKKYLKIKDRSFWKKFYHKIREYLVFDFELEGFEKEVIDTYCATTEILFTQK